MVAHIGRATICVQTKCALLWLKLAKATFFGVIKSAESNVIARSLPCCVVAPSKCAQSAKVPLLNSSTSCPVAKSFTVSTPNPAPKAKVSAPALPVRMSPGLPT